MPSLETNSVKSFRSLNSRTLVGMRDQDLRILLEDRRNGQRRNVPLDGIERLERVRAHVEFDFPGRQQDAVVHLRAAGHDRDVEAVLAIGAVGESLIESAVLAFATQSVPNETLSSVCVTGPDFPDCCAPA